MERRESLRIDKKEKLGILDHASLALAKAQVRWLEERDCVELRRALLAVLATLEDV